MKSQAVSAKDKVSDEAIYWVSKLHGGDLNLEDKLAFSEWLNRSHQHLQAFDELNATWAALGNAKFLPEIQYEIRSLNAVPVKKCNRRVALHSLQAACFGLLMFGAYSYYTKMVPGGSRPAAFDVAVSQNRYATTAGEDRVVELRDGSRIHLNTRSSVEVRYSGVARQVDLLNGEAHFEVMPDKSRPFVVKVARTRVTA
nr:FecR domain-containing protein [Cellvibrionaceae bacterium]